jgi:hypothetical protein
MAANVPMAAAALVAESNPDEYVRPRDERWFELGYAKGQQAQQALDHQEIASLNSNLVTMQESLIAAQKTGATSQGERDEARHATAVLAGIPALNDKIGRLTTELETAQATHKQLVIEVDHFRSVAHKGAEENRGLREMLDEAGAKLEVAELERAKMDEALRQRDVELNRLTRLTGKEQGQAIVALAETAGRIEEAERHIAQLITKLEHRDGEIMQLKQARIDTYNALQVIVTKLGKPGGLVNFAPQDSHWAPPSSSSKTSAAYQDYHTAIGAVIDAINIACPTP